jgi:hypothetical protein
LNNCIFSVSSRRVDRRLVFEFCIVDQWNKSLHDACNKGFIFNEGLSKNKPVVIYQNARPLESSLQISEQVDEGKFDRVN